ncbi:MAG: hypothetical protein ACRDVZ_02540, partial [Jiangellaceae bacterium]
MNALVSKVVQKRLTTTDRLAAALMRRKKISWRPLVDALLLDVAEGAQSNLELQNLRRVERAHGLPSGHRQRRRAGARVVWIDVDYDEYALRVELDGRLGHEDDGRFEIVGGTTVGLSSRRGPSGTGTPSCSTIRALWPPSRRACCMTAAGAAGPLRADPAVSHPNSSMIMFVRGRVTTGNEHDHGSRRHRRRSACSTRRPAVS